MERHHLAKCQVLCGVDLFCLCGFCDSRKLLLLGFFPPVLSFGVGVCSHQLHMHRTLPLMRHRIRSCLFSFPRMELHIHHLGSYRELLSALVTSTFLYMHYNSSDSLLTHFSFSKMNGCIYSHWRHHTTHFHPQAEVMNLIIALQGSAWRCTTGIT